MRTLVAACLVAGLVVPGTVSAQWGIAAEIGVARFGGSSRDTSGTTVGPYRPTTVELRLDRGRGFARVALALLYAKTGIAGEQPGLAVVQYDLASLCEVEPQVSFRLARFGAGVDVRLEAGPAIQLWTVDGDSRTRVAAQTAAALEWPLAGSPTGSLRVSGALSGSIFNADEPPRKSSGVRRDDSASPWASGIDCRGANAGGPGDHPGPPLCRPLPPLPHSPVIIFRRSTASLRLSEPSYTRSPTRTTTPPMIPRSVRKCARTSLPSAAVRRSTICFSSRASGSSTSTTPACTRSSFKSTSAWYSCAISPRSPCRPRRTTAWRNRTNSGPARSASARSNSAALVALATRGESSATTIRSSACTAPATASINRPYSSTAFLSPASAASSSASA